MSEDDLSSDQGERMKKSIIVSQVSVSIFLKHIEIQEQNFNTTLLNVMAADFFFFPFLFYLVILPITHPTVLMWLYTHSLNPSVTTFGQHCFQPVGEGTFKWTIRFGGLHIRG